MDIYFSRMVDNIEPMVKSIVENEFKETPDENDDGILVSYAPFDLFKIINENFELTTNIMINKEISIN